MEVAIKNSLTEAILKQSAHLYNIPPESIKYLGGFENFVYEYSFNNKPYIMRFVHSSHRTYNQVLAELEFQDYLAKHGVDVSPVIESKNKLICEKIDIDDNQFFYVSAFHKAPGRFMKDEDITEDFAKYFGEVVGKMHNLTKEFKPKHTRIHWHEETLHLDALPLLKEVDKFVYDEYIKVVKEIKKIIPDKSNYGLIHTDMHFGNILYNNGKITIFDFDDAAYKYFISDIAIILFYRDAFKKLDKKEVSQRTKQFLEPFLVGYRKHNQIDLDILKTLNLFIRLRIIVLYFAIYVGGEQDKDYIWGKQYLDKYRLLLKENQDYLDIKYVLE